MARTPEQLAEKFAREWLEAKPEAITNYVAIASTIAQRTIDSKQKMIDNFTAVMATQKFENRLRRYVGNELMGNAYSQALNGKAAITDAEKLKVQNDITLKRALGQNIDATLTLYKNAASGNVTVPPGITDVGLRTMLIQGINAEQWTLDSKSTPQAIYEATASYMQNNLGWPTAA